MRVGLGCLLLTLAGLGYGQGDPAEFFETQVRPVLAEHCFACHTTSKLGGLQIDTREGLLQGGKSGPAIVPGNPTESLLIKAINQSDAKLKMPMGAPKLKDEEIAALAHWIESGAPWPAGKTQPTVAKKGFSISPTQRAFWSFQPLRKPELPVVKDMTWVKNPIDNFILAKLEEKGLKPLKPASRRVLIRRATYDLIGLPPTPEEIEAFERDTSPDAYAKIIDRLLASPHYGERWGRHWMDVVRYADGDGPEDRPKGKQRGARGMTFVGFGMTKDGYANTWRYRDWLVDVLNQDMPYDLFVKAQIAADLLPDKSNKLLPGLGMFGLGPWNTGDCTDYAEVRADERDTRVDVVSKGLLGLTVTCARCHDHKYDPISQKDYYALAGIFNSSGYAEWNLASNEEVARGKAHQAKVREVQNALTEFLETSVIGVAETLARDTSRYMMAGRKIRRSKAKLDAGVVASEEKLDPETLKRWVKYLGATDRQHPYLRSWDTLMAKGGGSDEETRRLADEFQRLVLSIIAEKRETEATNREMKNHYKPDPNEAFVRLPGDLMQFELFQFKHNLVEKAIDPLRYYVWLDVVQGPPPARIDDFGKRTGILEYKDDELLRFYTPEQTARLKVLDAKLDELSKNAPPDYPYVMGLGDEPKPHNMRVNVRGNPKNLGEEVPRGFPAVLAGTSGDPEPFTQGSGRLQLAESIVRHPLTARVMANRIWMEHFGRGIVPTTTNFGQMGDRPSHPELLEYLTSRFVENHWSMKALHREIMLSGTYQLAYGPAEPNDTVDSDNRLLWRANLRRLDAEELRDSLLFVAGVLDERLGGPGQSLNLSNNKERTIYGRISRSGPNRALLLFDFPDPNISLDQRSATNVPLQTLFFMNSDVIWADAGLLAGRLAGETDDTAKIRKAYRMVYGRAAGDDEVREALKFLAKAEKDAGGEKPALQQFAQALLSSGEFNYIN
jgi:cytochrome c553